MKNLFKVLTITALIAVIGFSMIACGDLFNKDDEEDTYVYTPPNQTPSLSDFTVSGIGTFDFDYTLRKVTVAAKPNKTTGTTTVYYTGTGSTVYEKNEGEPLFKGTYSVTFDVAAASGWNEAKGLSAGTITIADGTPAVPTGLSASIASNTSIKINWTAASKATSYKVYYISDGDTALTLAGTVLGNTTTTYTHINTSANKNYWYYVTAVNSLGESNYSAVKAIATKAPDAPAQVVPTATSSSKMTVRWSEVTGATSYQIYWTLTQGGNKTAGNTFTSTSCDLANIPANTTVYCYVKAINVFGESDFSPVGSATTWAAGTAGTWNANLRATYVSGTMIEIAWTGNYTYYTVYYSTDPSSITDESKRICIVNFLPFNNYLDSQVQPNTTYYYWVKYQYGSFGVNSSGFSEMLVVGSGSAPPPPPPTPPSSSLSTPPAGGAVGARVCTVCGGTKDCVSKIYSCYNGYIDCHSCSGLFSSGSSSGKVCTTCKGTKKEKCGTCNGTGKCFSCGGTGVR